MKKLIILTVLTATLIATVGFNTRQKSQSIQKPQSIRATEAEPPVLTTIYAPEASTTVVDPVPVSKPEASAQPDVPPSQPPDAAPKPPEPKPFTGLTSQSTSHVDIQP